LDRKPTALLIATMDTKGQEALYMANCLIAQGIGVRILDAGIRGTSPVPVHVPREEVARAGGKELVEVQNIGHEGKALEIMTAGAVRCAQELYCQGEFQGVIGLGGSMGTTLGSAVMRSFPIGVPKVMISTMASRDTRAFVGTKDMLMLHSVSDLTGLNRITRKILRNGALALAGMLRYTAYDDEVAPSKPLVLVSTLGTTEACAQWVRTDLENAGKEVIIFHTVGAGGKAMEEMILQDTVAAVLDLSLHEIADHRFGGDYDAGPDRGSVALGQTVPTIIVPGNIDFLVTGPLKMARQHFPDRPYHVHNAAITVVRTTREEMKILAALMADLCNRARGPLAVLVPMGGFSAFDSKEGPLFDPDAPEIFASSLEKNLMNKSSLKVLPYHINDREFARTVIETLGLLIGE
jgi:uncharacterized protein (UPF0261 family)